MTRPQRGFALPLVLAVLVVLVLLASAIALTAMRMVERGGRSADQAAALIAEHGTQQTALYLLATRTRSSAGLAANREYEPQGYAGDDRWQLDIPVGDEIPLDGRALQGLDGTVFSLQDDSGLLSINFGPVPLLHAWLRQRGVQARQWPGLIARQFDFQDTDAQVRQGGAEQRAYLAAGLPPPTNQPIKRATDIRRFLGWGEVVGDLTDEALMSTLSAARQLSVNLNTAPAEVLTLIGGVTPEQAGRFIALRQQRPFLHPSDALKALGAIAFSNEEVTGFSTISGNSGILATWRSGHRLRRLAHFTLTPMDYGGRPWRLDFEVLLPTPGGDDVMAGIAETPLLAQP